MGSQSRSTHAVTATPRSTRMRGSPQSPQVSSITAASRGMAYWSRQSTQTTRPPSRTNAPPHSQAPTGGPAGDAG